MHHETYSNQAQSVSVLCQNLKSMIGKTLHAVPEVQDMLCQICRHVMSTYCPLNSVTSSVRGVLLHHKAARGFAIVPPSRRESRG